MAKKSVRRMLESKGIAIPGGPAKEPLRSKYHTSPAADRTADGIVYDSKLEMGLHRALVSSLDSRVRISRQVPFNLAPSFRLSAGGPLRRAVSYVADFVLDPGWGFDGTNGLPAGCQVLDAKGMVTDVYALKKKLFEARYDTVLQEVKSLSSIHKIKETMEQMLTIDPALARTVTAGVFKVSGYQSKSENTVSDLTLMVIGRAGYENLARLSLAALDTTAAPLVPCWADYGFKGAAEAEEAVGEVRKSLEKVLNPESEATHGKEARVQISPNLMFTDGDAGKVVVLRMMKIREENVRPLDPEKKASAKRGKTLFKEALLKQLPAGNYLHRVNLYPGTYEGIAPA